MLLPRSSRPRVGEPLPLAMPRVELMNPPIFKWCSTSRQWASIFWLIPQESGRYRLWTWWVPSSRPTDVPRIFDGYKWNCAISIHSITRRRLFLSTASLADDVLFWIAYWSGTMWYFIVAKPIFGQYFIPLTIHAISREQQFLGQTKIPSERQVKERLLQWSLGEECIYMLMVSKSTLSRGFIPDTFNESPWKKQNIKQPMHLCFSRVLSIKSKGMESRDKLSLKLLKNSIFGYSFWYLTITVMEAEYRTRCVYASP